MKEKYLIFLGVAAVIAVAFFYTSSMMINAKLTNIRRVDRNIRRAQERLNSARVMDEQLSQVSKVIDNTLTNTRNFTADEVNTFIKDLAALADKYQIAVYSSQPRAVHSTTNNIEHQFVMNVMCTYVQFGQFLAEIERLDYIIKVNTIDVKPIRTSETVFMVDGEQVTQYNVVLELSALKIVKEA